MGTEGDDTKRFKLNGYTAHAVAIGFSLAFGGGGLASYKQLSDKLDDLRTTVAEIKVQGTAAEKAAGKVDTALLGILERVAKIEQAAAAHDERVHEHERRLAVLEKAAGR